MTSPNPIATIPPDIARAAAGLPPCLRRKEAESLCRTLGLPRSVFRRWCASPPPLPEGMAFRKQMSGAKKNTYLRSALLWLAAQTVMA